MSPSLLTGRKKDKLSGVRRRSIWTRRAYSRTELYGSPDKCAMQKHRLVIPAKLFSRTKNKACLQMVLTIASKCVIMSVRYIGQSHRPASIQPSLWRSSLKSQSLYKFWSPLKEILPFVSKQQWALRKISSQLVISLLLWAIRKFRSESILTEVRAAILEYLFQ